MELVDLNGKKGLVVGIANEESLVTWAGKSFVEPIAGQVEASLFLQRNVSQPGQLEAVFDAIRDRWGTLDFIFHSFASARKNEVHGRLMECSAEGFSEAMVVSCHSLIRMAKLAEPFMTSNGSIYYAHLSGRRKGGRALQRDGAGQGSARSAVRYLAHEMGKQGVRVNAISAGPVKTRAASGLMHFDELLDEAARKAPQRRLIDPCKVGKPPFCWPVITRPRSPAKLSMSTADSISKAWFFIDWT